MIDARTIAAALAERRLSQLERATAARVRNVWREARADADAVIRAHEKTPVARLPESATGV